MIVDYSRLEEFLAKIQAVMRPYQIKVVSHTKKNPFCIIDSPGGTGKTLMGLTSTFIYQPKRILVLCSSNALWTWYKESQKWFPDYAKPEMYQVIDGKPTERQAQWSRNCLFYVLTSKMFLQDVDYIIEQGEGFDVLMVDEYHRTGLRNHKSQFTIAVDKLHRALPFKAFFPMTGSTIRKGPRDFFGVLNIFAPKLFSSYWKFIHTFHIVMDGMFGKEIGGPQNTKGFAEITRPYLIKVPQEEADKERPKLSRVFIDMEMSKLQKKHYANLEENLWTEIESGELVIASMALVRMVKFRQLLCCPKILGINDMGTSFETVVDKIKDMEYDRTTIFVPFIGSIPFIKDGLQQRFPKLPVHILQGGDRDKIPLVESAFRKSGGIVLVSIAFAQSFELETSQDCHFLGFDWDQENNKQCEWRCQRMTSDLQKPINAYYYRYMNTVDDRVCQVLNDNTKNCRITFQDVKSIKEFLRGTNNG